MEEKREEFQEATALVQKTRRKMSIIEDLESGKEKRAIRAIVVVVAFSFLALFRRRANKPNEVVTRRICTYVREKNLFLTYIHRYRVTFFRLHYDRPSIFTHRSFVNIYRGFHSYIKYAINAFR